MAPAPEAFAVPDRPGIAARVFEAIAAEEVPWQDERLQVSVAYGAHVLSGGQRADDALDAADRAMYANKRGGRQEA